MTSILDLYGLIFPKEFQKTSRSISLYIADEGEISYRIGDFDAQFMRRMWRRVDG